MLKITNLCKSFAGAAAPILQDLNLEIAAGEFCVIIGSNGSGKSTLLRAISGEEAIDSGEIRINGSDFSRHARHHVIATVIQDIRKSTIPELTMLENMVLSSMRIKAATFKTYKHHRLDMLRHLEIFGNGLNKYIDQPLSVLSGGQRQSLATLMAIISKPQILLLDEHTSALDPITQQTLMEYTAQCIAEYNITTLMITHKLDDALKYGNRLVMLRNGYIALDVAGTAKSQLMRCDLEQHYAS